MIKQELKDIFKKIQIDKSIKKYVDTSQKYDIELINLFKMIEENKDLIIKAYVIT